MKKLYSFLFLSQLIFCPPNNLFPQVNVVPSSANYATLGAAFTAINSGSHGSGAITVTILSGTTEPAAAILNGGVFSSCNVRPSANVAVTSSSFNEAIIVLDGADNVTIDGRVGGTGTAVSLILNNTNPGVNTGAIRMSNGASNNIVKYVDCRGTGAGTTTGGRIIHIAQSTSTGNNDNTIESCIVNGGRRGIQTFGITGILNERTIIKNNKVKNVTTLGIFLGNDTKDNMCEGNEVYFDTAVITDLNYRAISVQSSGSNVIRKNKVYSLKGLSTSGFSGIVVIPQVPPALISAYNFAEVSNNFVSIMDNNAEATAINGITCQSTNYSCYIYFNSVRLGGTSNQSITSQSIAFGERLVGTLGLDTVRVYNNLFINERTGGDANSLHIGSDIDPAEGVSLESDYNTYFAIDTTGIGWDVRYDGTLFKGAEGNKIYYDSTCSAGIEQRSVFDNVHFVSNTDLHLAGRIAGNMDALPIAGIVTDIDNTPRAITSTNLFTYRGADEHLPTGDSLWRKSSKIIQFAVQGLSGLMRAAGDGIGGIDIGLKKKPGGTISICHTTTDTILNNIMSCKLYLGDSITKSAYEIQLLTANTIRTFSSNAVSFLSDTGTYNFTTSLNQAYGNNMFGTSPPFQIYTGDVNQDDVVDLADASQVDNDAFNFTTGCRVATDVNYDNFVDVTDGAIVDNNSFNFVGAIIPPD